MTPSEIRQLILAAVAEIAPEADTSRLRDDEDMREALDLDSIDFSNLVITLHERTGRDIPEADTHRLHRLHRLRDAVAYLAAPP
jgi:acyl carrier protein